MRLMICLSMAASLVVAPPALAQATQDSVAAKPVPADLAPQVEAAMRRGNLLYAYDEAAWHGTDEFVERHKPLLEQAGGYVVTGTSVDPVLAFYDEAKTKALFRASFHEGKMVQAGPPPAGSEALTAMEQRMIRARDLAKDAFAAGKVSICTNGKPNVAVLPPETEGGPSIAYLMSARVKLDELPLGGHYSVTVSDDGKVGPIRKFTKACATLPLTNADGKGAKPVGLFTTHLLDPTPTEIHVFSSLTAKLPLYLSTTENGRVWSVADGKIRFVQNLNDKK